MKTLKFLEVLDCLNNSKHCESGCNFVAVCIEIGVKMIEIQERFNDNGKDPKQECYPWGT